MPLPMFLAGAITRGIDLMTSGWAARKAAPLEARPTAQVIPFAGQATTAERVLPAGLAETSQIQAFLQQDFGGQGRTVALRDPQERARAAALDGMRAQFDNILCCVVSSHREHNYKLEQLRVDLCDDEVESATNQIARKARLALAHNQERIDELEEQRRLAKTGQGWYGAAAIAFNSGFDRGMRECADILKLLA